MASQLICTTSECRSGMFIGIGLMLFVFVILYLTGVLSFKKKSGFRSRESFSPSYDKELQLFKGMGSKEQEEYLNLSRGDKLIKYGNKLA